MWIWENSRTGRHPKSGELTQLTLMKTNALELTKNFSLIFVVVLVFGLGVASAQTTNFPGSLTIGPSNSVGSYSMALGEFNRATGSNSVAMGYCATASGDNSMAFGAGGVLYVIAGQWIYGYNATASGFASAAFNQGVSCCDYGFAANCSWILPPNVYNMAPSANNAASLNYGDANADYCFVANLGTANNYLSAAFGFRTGTASPAQFVVGMMNRMVGTNEDWTTPFDWTGYSSPTNALFIVGNGYEDEDENEVASNALQVRKDGLVLINPGGDLNTGSYTNGPTP